LNSMVARLLGGPAPVPPSISSFGSSRLFSCTAPPPTSWTVFVYAGVGDSDQLSPSLENPSENMHTRASHQPVVTSATIHHPPLELSQLGQVGAQLALRACVRACVRAGSLTVCTRKASDLIVKQHMVRAAPEPENERVLQALEQPDLRAADVPHARAAEQAPVAMADAVYPRPSRLNIS
jgi:hypothetical protein